MVRVAEGFGANLVETRLLGFVVHRFLQIVQSLLRFINCGIVYHVGRYFDTFGVGGAVGDVFDLAAAVAPELADGLVLLALVLGSSLSPEQERGRPTVFAIIVSEDRAQFTFLLIDGAFDVGRFNPGLVVEVALDVDLEDLQRIEEHVDAFFEVGGLFGRIDFVDVIVFLVGVLQVCVRKYTYAHGGFALLLTGIDPEAVGVRLHVVSIIFLGDAHIVVVYRMVIRRVGFSSLILFLVSQLVVVVRQHVEHFDAVRRRVTNRIRTAGSMNSGDVTAVVVVIFVHVFGVGVLNRLILVRLADVQLAYESLLAAIGLFIIHI